MRTFQVSFNMDLSWRVTEAANPLTEGLDVAPPDALVRLLAGCDAQLFVGAGGLPGLHSDAVVGAAAHAAAAVAGALAHPRGHVVFAGCGTSGRLAHLLARDLNVAAGATNSPPRFHYLLAGGDGALLVPQEAEEDSPEAGVRDLRAWQARAGAGPADPVVVFGVSCGLSATYVASILHAALDAPAWCPVAVGFNPVAAVADVRVPGWPHSFAAVLGALGGPPVVGDGAASAASARPTRGLVLNPVVGPETVAGSSRMKGGSATVVLLAPVCQAGAAVAAAGGPAATAAAATAAGLAALRAQLRGAFLQLADGVARLYSAAAPDLAALVAAGARSLTTRVTPPLPLPPAGAAPRRALTPTGWGRILYIGGGHAGLLGLIDASEATDTYGSAFNEVRAWCDGGWPAMGVGADAADPRVPPELRRPPPGSAPLAAEAADPALAAFVRDAVPTLGPADTVVLLHLDEAGSGGGSSDGGVAPAVLAAAAAAAAAGADVRHVLVVAAGDAGDAAVAAAAAVALGGGVALRLPAVSLSWAPRLAAPPLRAAEAVAAGRDAGTAAPSSVGSLALKLALNALTTGAHVARGAVVRNVMVNMMLTNHKLFHRAVRIVADVARVAPAAADDAVLRAVYGVDGDAELAGVRASDGGAAGGGDVITRHIARASVTEHVIPVAIMLAAGVGTVADARRALAAQPVVRLALARAGDGRP